MIKSFLGSAVRRPRKGASDIHLDSGAIYLGTNEANIARGPSISQILRRNFCKLIICRHGGRRLVNEDNCIILEIPGIRGLSSILPIWYIFRFESDSERKTRCFLQDINFKLPRILAKNVETFPGVPGKPNDQSLEPCDRNHVLLEKVAAVPGREADNPLADRTKGKLIFC